MRQLIGAIYQAFGQTKGNSTPAFAHNQRPAAAAVDLIIQSNINNFFSQFFVSEAHIDKLK